MRKCKECGGKYYSKGYCKRHCLQFIRHGKILHRTRFDPNEIIVKGDKAEMKNKYVAQIGISQKNFRLGSFDTAEQAAEMYNEAAKWFHGEFAYLNPVGVDKP